MAALRSGDQPEHARGDISNGASVADIQHRDLAAFDDLLVELLDT